MLKFISLLFSEQAQRSNGLDDALIEKGILRVVGGTDRRLVALADYQRKLREPVEGAIQHVIALVDNMPPPLEISPKTFSEYPQIRALFVSVDHLREVLTGLDNVREYLAKVPGIPPDAVYGVLSMARDERNVFAMELDGDTIKRDVMQVAVNFSRHRYLGPAGSEAECRLALKKQAFDFLIEKALEQITRERGKRLELGGQRVLLKQKLDAMRAGRFGLGGILNETDVKPANLTELEAEIKRIDRELALNHADNLSLEESLAIVVDTLSRPADILASREISLRLDYRGIKVPDSAGVPANDITLTEIYSGTSQQRTVIHGYIPRSDIPEPPDFWKLAKRYL